MSKSAASRTLVFAGGGTAGHVEPAIAVAHAWRQRYPNDRCIFLGTLTGLESRLVPAAGFELCNIEKVVMPRRADVELLKLPLGLFRSVKSAKQIIDGSDLLIGFGGYLSASAYLAASIAGVPILVHEANAKAGWANRLGSCFTKNLAVAHPFSRGRFSRATLTGLPLRADVQAAFHRASRNWQQARNEAKTKLGWSLEGAALLILGGSQGSTYINSQIEDALPGLNKKGLQILHSVGSNNPVPTESQKYRAVPYISDMPTAYLAADVILARSGAVTCAEIGALGRFAVFVPLPIGNGEQARNAERLVTLGRAIVIPQKAFSSQWLLSNIEDLCRHSENQSENGFDYDMQAETKIVEIMERILQ